MPRPWNCSRQVSISIKLALLTLRSNSTHKLAAAVKKSFFILLNQFNIDFRRSLDLLYSLFTGLSDLLVVEVFI